MFFVSKNENACQKEDWIRKQSKQPATTTYLLLASTKNTPIADSVAKKKQVAFGSRFRDIPVILIYSVARVDFRRYARCTTTKSDKKQAFWRNVIGDTERKRTLVYQLTVLLLCIHLHSKWPVRFHSDEGKCPGACLYSFVVPIQSRYFWPECSFG